MFFIFFFASEKTMTICASMLRETRRPTWQKTQANLKWVLNQVLKEAKVLTKKKEWNVVQAQAAAVAVNLRNQAEDSFTSLSRSLWSA